MPGIRSAATTALRLAAMTYLFAAATLLVWSRAPTLVGWEPRVVVSGSMLPAIRVGDVALVERVRPGPATLRPGQVVLVRDPSRSTGSYLHRLVRYDAAGRLVTRGDANAVDDYPAVDPARVAGRLRLVVPVVGLPMIWWQQHAWLRLAVLGGGTWAALVITLGGVSRRSPRRVAH